MTAYRQTGARPRICVPGVLVVDVDSKRLRIGARWDGFEDLSQWKSLVTLARARDLPPLSFPDHPRVAAAFAGAPFVEVSDETTLLGLRERKVPLLEIGFARNADDWFRFSFELRTISASLYALAGSLDEEALESLDHALFLERILMAASDGAIDAELLSRAITLGEVMRAPSKPVLDDLERELGEIEARATTQRESALAIVDAIEHAESDEITVAVYGRARRIRHPPIDLKSGEHRAAVLSIDGEHTLTLPAHDEWQVDDVERWAPEAREQREARTLTLHRDRSARELRKAKWIAITVAALLLGCIALGILTRPH